MSQPAPLRLALTNVRRYAQPPAPSGFSSPTSFAGWSAITTIARHKEYRTLIVPWQGGIAGIVNRLHSKPLILHVLHDLPRPVASSNL